MTELVTAQNRKEYEAFVQSHPKGHFAQSLAWGAQKANWDWEGILYRDERGSIRGSIALLFHRLPAGFGTLAYSCRGPVCDPQDKTAISALILEAKNVCAAHRAVALRMDPDIPASDAEFAKIVKGLGFDIHTGGGHLDQTQAKYVFRVPLQGRSEEEVFAALHQKTRYNVRLAKRKGVQVRICGKEMIPAFTSLMETTGQRDKFAVRNADYFARVLDNFGEHARLYMAFYEEEPIAGTIEIVYGDKAWYLYGASGNHHRELMPNYLLQWEMIRWAIESGCRLYDLRGVPGILQPEDPLYGLYRFKKGFGGEFTEFIGEMDLILRPLPYKIMREGMSLYAKSKKLSVALKRKKEPEPVYAGKA